VTEYDPDSQADGRYIVAFVESAGEVSPVFEQKVRQIFENHLSGVDSGKWYRTGDVAAAFAEINDTVGAATMKKGGVESARAVPWPDDTDTVGTALQTVQEMHREAFRDSELENPAGNYTCRDIGDRVAHVGITEGFPFAPVFAEGVFEQIGRQFGPEDGLVQLETTTPHDDEAAAWEMTW
jgi:hypothetical protein